MVLTDLCKPEYLKLNYTKLLKKASDVTLAVSCKDVSIVEQKIRGQAKSRVYGLEYAQVELQHLAAMHPLHH